MSESIAIINWVHITLILLTVSPLLLALFKKPHDHETDASKDRISDIAFILHVAYRNRCRNLHKVIGCSISISITHHNRFTYLFSIDNPMITRLVVEFSHKLRSMKLSITPAGLRGYSFRTTLLLMIKVLGCTKILRGYKFACHKRYQSLNSNIPISFAKQCL